MIARCRPPLDFAVQAPLARGDVPPLCAGVERLIDGRGSLVLHCDLRGAAADVVTVEALARLQLVARRRGCQVRLRGASDELMGLVHLLGLAEQLPGEPWRRYTA